jgi:hypothetical protein
VIPIDQTDLGPGPGDCLRACVASIFERPLDETPHFLRDAPDAWLDALDRWLADRFGLAAVLVRLTDPPACTLPRGYCIASGPAPGYPKHSVVWHNGRLAHDPHPGRIGLTRAADLILFTVPDPKGVRAGDDHA